MRKSNLANKIVSLVLSVCLLICAMPVLDISASAASLTEAEFISKISALKSEYPHGKYWNKYNGTDSNGVAKAGSVACKGVSNYTGSSCVSHGYCAYGGSCTCDCGYYYGWQCFGFANLMAYKTFGSYATTNYYSSGVNTSKGWKYYTSVSEYYAGDVVRINNNHSIFIIKVDGSTVYYVDCNYSGPCKINWNNSISVSSLKSKTTFVVHMSGNTLKGVETKHKLTVQYNANGGEIPGSDTAVQYKVVTSAGLNMRKYADVDSEIVGGVGVNKTFTVTDVEYADGYTWGYTTFNGNSGWCVISEDWTTQVTSRNTEYYLTASGMVYVSSADEVKNHVMTYGTYYEYGLFSPETFGIVRDGYKFVGWAYGSEIIDETVGIYPEDIVAELSSSDREIIVYAVWEETECTHNYNTQTTAPTCTGAGYTTYTCSECGDSYTADEVEALGHSYEETVTPPTATAQGYTTYTCAACGDSYKDNYTAATGNKVQNMQVSATDTDITVTWDAIEGTTKYNLYVKNQEGTTIITRALDATSTSVTLSWPNELEWDETYSIGIRARTTTWLDTAYVEAALVVDDRIVDVKTESVGRTIQVNWKAYEGATQYYVYVYEKGAYSEGAITSVKATTNSATIINAISPETDYEVRVIATKGVTKMATIDALSVDARLNVFTPDAFTNRGITPNKVAVSFDEVRGADKYWVYLTPVGEGETIVKESTKAIASISGLAPNTTYNVQIQARITDANGKTHYSGQSEVVGTITTTDWEEISFTATSTESGANLTWTAPTNAYSYIIYRSTNGGKSYKKLATISDGATISYVDTAAKNGYIYAIKTQLQDDYITATSGLVKSAAIVK